MSTLPVSDPARAALWMIGAMLSFSLMAVAGRELSGELDTFEIMLYRSLIGLVVVLAVATAAGALRDIRCRMLGTHVARNAFHFAGQNLWFYAVGFIPLSQLFAFEFSTPLWGALFAPLVVGERWTGTRLAACGLGFVGILVVARPDSLALSDAQSAPWVVVVGVCGLIAHFSLAKALKLAVAPDRDGGLPALRRAAAVVSLCGFGADLLRQLAQCAGRAEGSGSAANILISAACRYRFFTLLSIEIVVCAQACPFEVYRQHAHAV